MRKARKISAIFSTIILLLSTMNVPVFAEETADLEEDRVYIVNDDFEDKEP